MRKLFSVLLALSCITFWNPLVASSHDDDNAAAPGVGRAGSTNTGLALTSHPFLSETNVRSFNLDSLIFSRELDLFRPLQARYKHAMEDLAQQTGNPTLFRQDHAASYSHFTLAQLEELVKQKTLKGALDPEKRGGQAYFEIEELLKDTSLQTLSCSFKGLLLCPTLRHATHLEMLNIGGNNLTTLPSLNALTNLRELMLDDNNLITLPGLDALMNLTYLSFNGNQLTKLPGLNALTNLHTLYLEHNYHLTSLPGLEVLTNLQALFLDESQAEKVEILRPLVSLIDRQKEGHSLVVSVKYRVYAPEYTAGWYPERAPIRKEVLRIRLMSLSGDGQTHLEQ